MSSSDGAGAPDFEHAPVMVEEITAVFANVPSGTIVDATLGGGGHTAALLDSRDDLDVIGIDQDHDALQAATTRLAGYGDRLRTSQRRFDQLDEALAAIREEAPQTRISGGHGVHDFRGPVPALVIHDQHLERLRTAP